MANTPRKTASEEHDRNVSLDNLEQVRDPDGQKQRSAEGYSSKPSGASNNRGETAGRRQ